jgi:hypothetical protein
MVAPTYWPSGLHSPPFLTLAWTWCMGIETWVERRVMKVAVVDEMWLF